MSSFMNLEIPVAKLRYVGDIDVSAIHDKVVSYMKNRKFWLEYPQHKVKSDEFEEIIVGKKKIDDLIAYTGRVYILAETLTPKEVMVDGKKKTIYHGRVTITIHSGAVAEYDWGTSNFSKFMKYSFKNILYKKKFYDYHKDECFFAMFYLVAQLRETLNMTF